MSEAKEPWSIRTTEAQKDSMNTEAIKRGWSKAQWLIFCHDQMKGGK